MSSHHFVKEGQESALLILDPVNFSLVAPLLEWSPTVIVSQPALELVISWGIKIDVVLLLEPPDESLKHKLQSQDELSIFHGHAIDDLLDSALHLLIRTKQSSVSIVSDDAAKLFKNLHNFRDLLSVSILSPAVRWVLVSSGSFKKWLPAGSKLRFHGPTEHVQTSSLEKRGETFEVVSDGIIEVRNTEPFWVGEIL